MKRNIYIKNTPLQEAMLSFNQALNEAGFFKTGEEWVDVGHCLGRVTSRPVLSKRSSPHYQASAMDGIAVRAKDTYTASETTPVRIAESSYLMVDTGDYVPPPYDAVIMIEDVNFFGNEAEIIKAAVPWQHIRSVGEDLVAQDMIVPSSYPLGSYEIAALISAAVDKVAVFKQPVVGIIPTGTELVPTASPDLEPGKIVESNSYMLAALCQGWGAKTIRHSIVEDDWDKLLQAVREMEPQSDLLVICSGSSAGREDYTSAIIASLGRVLNHGLAIKPGKPAILGLIGENKPVIGVPGYPVSAQLVFTLFARPLIYRRQGLVVPEPEEMQCQLTRKIASPMGVDEFVYVNLAKLQDRYLAYPLSRGAGISSNLVRADGVIKISSGQEGINVGEYSQAVLMRPRHEIERSLVCMGSHDLCIDLLIDYLRRRHEIRLLSTNVGSMGGLMALMRGETHMAGIHLLDTEQGNYNISYVQRYLSGKNWRLINVARRQQGLIVKKGNPLGITGLAQLLDPGIRFINRQKGAGTRILLDYLLKRDGVDPAGINGYTREEYTHLAVAAAVKNDACDCGLGIMASARVMDLDFIPLAEEQYDLCILTDLIPEAWTELLLEALQSPDFQERLRKMGGYNLELSGQVLAANKLH
ncbi:MAG TPA: molybdopterin biosynthesis protein [Syntrophomonas sp.]|jgi:putative molybdopterin biosynthesis protein|nr:molybdopterin biosynthesis protein [Syntrophomonas sp.]